MNLTISRQRALVHGGPWSDYVWQGHKTTRCRIRHADLEWREMARRVLPFDRVRIAHPAPTRLASARGTAGADGWSTTPLTSRSTLASGYTAKASVKASRKVGFSWQMTLNPRQIDRAERPEVTGVGRVRKWSRYANQIYTSSARDRAPIARTASSRTGTGALEATAKTLRRAAHTICPAKSAPCYSFVTSTRDHVRSGSNAVIPAAMLAVLGPRSF